VIERRAAGDRAALALNARKNRTLHHVSCCFVVDTGAGPSILEGKRRDGPDAVSKGTATMATYAYTDTTELQVRLTFTTRELFALIEMTKASDNWIQTSLNRTAREALAGAVTSLELEAVYLKDKLQKVSESADTVEA
jgi:hypothetical protein